MYSIVNSAHNQGDQGLEQFIISNSKQYQINREKGVSEGRSGPGIGSTRANFKEPQFF